MDVQPLIPTPFRPRRGNPRYPNLCIVISLLLIQPLGAVRVRA